MNIYLITCYFEKNYVFSYEITADNIDDAYDILYKDHSIDPFCTKIELIS